MADNISTPTYRFKGKLFFTGKIRVLTGLHIGGSKSDLEIGGIDLNVVKTAGNKRIPFIPGSSLKGKLRSLLARIDGSESVLKDSDEIKAIFGHSGDEEEAQGKVTRLAVRDAFMEEDDIAEFDKKFDRDALETSFTEAKWENVIDRKTGTAKHPRQVERVPAGSYFSFEMVYDMYALEEASSTDWRPKSDTTINTHINMINKAMRMLQDDYLGGQGSRGYGRIAFENVTIQQRLITDYEAGTGRQTSEFSYQNTSI